MKAIEKDILKKEPPDEAYRDLKVALLWLKEHPGRRPPHIPANRVSAFANLVYRHIRDTYPKKP
jgi:hypothetical protein